jgi:hypothetical protein
VDDNDATPPAKVMVIAYLRWWMVDGGRMMTFDNFKYQSHACQRGALTGAARPSLANIHTSDVECAIKRTNSATNY